MAFGERYTYTFQNIETLIGQNKLKNGKHCVPHAKEIFPGAILDTRAIVSAALTYCTQDGHAQDPSRQPAVNADQK
jgi:hypothetical protein